LSSRSPRQPAPAPLATYPAAGLLLIRAALPGDADALVAMHDRCSLESRVARWHAPIRGIPASYLSEVTAGAPSHAGVVATKGGEPAQLIGLASACLVSPGAWELGVLVEDACQRQGVGRAMLRALVDEVLRRGARELLAVSLDERRAVLRNLAELGPVAFSAEQSTVTARVLLEG
jgi:GNAT superfamily N-acetyltransferase